MGMMALFGIMFYIFAASIHFSHQELITEWTRTTAAVESVTPIEHRRHMRYAYAITYDDGDGTHTITQTGGGKAPFAPGDVIDVIFNPADTTDVRPVPADPAPAIAFFLFGGTLALLVAGIALKKGR
ncbi:DUF3592 domain-containing protein [Hyphomicrobium sp.]|uniref:DUF3592 domain-containing protein n=1 Tax=Hyphomicrobium sp. TaxID=82 RepID=UPI002FDFA843